MVVIMKVLCRVDRYLSTELQNSYPDFGPSGVRYKGIVQKRRFGLARRGHSRKKPTEKRRRRRIL